MAACTLCLLAALCSLRVARVASLSGATLDLDAMQIEVSLVQVRPAAVVKAPSATVLRMQAMRQRYGFFQTGLEADKELDSGLFNCSAFPELCEAPFNCGGPIEKRVMTSTGPGYATESGHANRQWGCGTPTLSEGHVACASGKLAEYARLTFTAQKSVGAVDLTDFDAQYCFISGHCNYTGPIPTSIEAMETMCDWRFHGRQYWTTEFGISYLGSAFASDGLFLKSPSLPAHLSLSQKFAAGLGKLSCAVGSFHCDAAYCRDMYCNDPAYSAKYRHLAQVEHFPAEYYCAYCLNETAKMKLREEYRKSHPRPKKH